MVAIFVIPVISMGMHSPLKNMSITFLLLLGYIKYILTMANSKSVQTFLQISSPVSTFFTKHLLIFGTLCSLHCGHKDFLRCNIYNTVTYANLYRSCTRLLILKNYTLILL